MIVNLITKGNEQEKNYWGELSSVICCERSDVYLRALMGKVQDHFFDVKKIAKKILKQEKKIAEMQAKK